MSEHYSQSDGRLCRIDKYSVPAASRDEFIERATATHDFLSKQPGYLSGQFLEIRSGQSEFNFVSIAVWEAGAADLAAGAVAQYHASQGYDPAQALIRLGIKADQGFYQIVLESAGSAVSM